MNHFPKTAAVLPAPAVATLVRAARECQHIDSATKRSEYLDAVTRQVKREFPQYFREEI